MPIAVLACLTLGLTVAAGPVFDLSVRAAEQLLDPMDICLGPGRRRMVMLLGDLLLALAWAALKGEFSLANLLTGFVLGT